MPQNFFITGKPKTGKTTIMERLVEELKSKGLKVGGFLSPAEEERGSRSEFHVEDIETRKRGVLASVNGGGIKVSKYYVKLPSFERIALPSMKAVDKYDVIVLDEIGHMEMRSTKFDRLLDDVFESETPVVAALNKDYVDQFTAEGEVLMLSRTNQEAVFRDLVDKATSAYTGAKRKKPKKKTIPKKGGKKRVSGKKKTSADKKGKEPEKKKERHSKDEKKGFIDYVSDLLGF
jgi:nucleoside-triphosphatase